MKKNSLDYPFLLGFDLSNANAFNEYQEYMNGLLKPQEMDEVDPSDWNSFDYDGQDIGTATVNEMRLQNGDY